MNMNLHTYISANISDNKTSFFGIKSVRSFIKRCIDVVGAVFFLVILLPVLLGVTLLILIDDGFPVLFMHQRIGRAGRAFNCLKFRTMRRDAGEILNQMLAGDPEIRADWAAARKIKNDPRITRVGAFLRSTSLDELPQLVNILSGEMSFVGPRPVVAKELEEFYAPLGGLTAYLAVRPGLTGPWQVSGRSDTDYVNRVHLDTQYAMRPSLRSDAAILARTIKVVLSRKGAY
jgi:exopolysaccharide production protein ExoY